MLKTPSIKIIVAKKYLDIEIINYIVSEPRMIGIKKRNPCNGLFMTHLKAFNK